MLASGDPRFGLPTQPELMARNLGDIKAWLSPQFATGPVEIAIAGDFDPKVAGDAVAKTFGALPVRAPKPDYAAERKVALPQNPSEQDFTVETKIPGKDSCCWYGQRPRRPRCRARPAPYDAEPRSSATGCGSRSGNEMERSLSPARGLQRRHDLSWVWLGRGPDHCRSGPLPRKSWTAVLAMKLPPTCKRTGVTADEL